MLRFADATQDPELKPAWSKQTAQVWVWNWNWDWNVLESVWNYNGICLEFRSCPFWDLFGIYLEFVWNLATCLEAVWNLAYVKHRNLAKMRECTSRGHNKPLVWTVNSNVRTRDLISWG